MKTFISLAVFAMLAGCSANGVVKPDKYLMESCPALPEIPANEARDPAARKSYYIESRKLYGSCADKAEALQGVLAAIAKR